MQEKERLCILILKCSSYPMPERWHISKNWGCEKCTGRCWIYKWTFPFLKNANASEKSFLGVFEHANI